MRGIIIALAIIAGFMLATTPTTQAEAANINFTGNATPLKLNEILHNQFMQNEQYALADTLLNATWKQVKPNVSEAHYKQILQEQRDWATSGRDETASRYATSMFAVDAFIKAMLDRTAELIKLMGLAPQRGQYESKYASFTVTIQGGTVFIEGDAYSERGNVCSFDGKGTAGNGWITMKHFDSPDFYLLFTRQGAQIAYTTSGEAQGCGMGVGFNYSYTQGKVTSSSTQKPADTADCGTLLKIDAVPGAASVYTMLSEDGTQKYYYSMLSDDTSCVDIEKVGANICFKTKFDDVDNMFGNMPINGNVPKIHSVSQCRVWNSPARQASAKDIKPGAQTLGSIQRACGDIKNLTQFDANTYSFIIQDVLYTQGNFYVHAKSPCGALVKEKGTSFCFSVEEKIDSAGVKRNWVRNDETCLYAN